MTEDLAEVAEQGMNRAETAELNLPEAHPEWNRITGEVIRAAMAVHSYLGPIGLESVFERALVVQLKQFGLGVQQQVPVQLRYLDEPIGAMVIDLLVENVVVLELKCVERVLDVHFAQLASYLRHGDFPLGLLINFRVTHLRDGLHRRINGRSTRFLSSSAPTA